MPFLLSFLIIKWFYVLLDHFMTNSCKCDCTKSDRFNFTFDLNSKIFLQTFSCSRSIHIHSTAKETALFLLHQFLRLFFAVKIYNKNKFQAKFWKKRKMLHNRAIEYILLVSKVHFLWCFYLIQNLGPFKYRKIDSKLTSQKRYWYHH